MNPRAESPADPLGSRFAWGLAGGALVLAFIVRLGRVLAVEGGEAAWGWLALPVLAAWFFRERWRDRPPVEPGPAPGLVALVAGGAFAVLAPARWLGEAFPGWPAVEWAMGAAWATLAWLLVATARGWPGARHVLFALFFPLAALPWPAFIAVEMMGRLRLASAAGLAELFSLFGEPAVANGTVIELRQGLIGIEDACGGIRSLQAAVVMALAIGELRRDGVGRRVGWVALGAGWAIAANTARMAVLTALCAQGGTIAVARWHDAAGMAEFFVALGGLAAVAWRSGLGVPARATAPSETAPRASGWPWGVVAGVVAVELAVLGWFARAEASSRGEWDLTADLARGMPSFVAADGQPAMRATLRSDALQVGQWRGPGGGRRSGYVVEWQQGQRAALVLPSHNPGVCLPAAGARVAREWPTVEFETPLLKLPFRVQEYDGAGGRFFFFHVAWNVTTGAPLDYGADAMLLTWRERWRETIAGRRDVKVVLIGLAIHDAASFEQAKWAARDELGRILRAVQLARD